MLSLSAGRMSQSIYFLGVIAPGDNTITYFIIVNFDHRDDLYYRSEERGKAVRLFFCVFVWHINL